MKKLFIILTAAIMCASCTEQFNAAYLLSGGAKVAQAATLTDEQIQAYVAQYVAQCPAPWGPQPSHTQGFQEEDKEMGSIDEGNPKVMEITEVQSCELVSG